MKAHELAKKLLECPDFEVVFGAYTKEYSDEYGEDNVYRYFNKLEVYDIGYSDQVVILSGKETE